MELKILTLSNQLARGHSIDEVDSFPLKVIKHEEKFGSLSNLCIECLPMKRREIGARIGTCRAVEFIHQGHPWDVVELVFF